jgi:hypothetical protein
VTEASNQLVISNTDATLRILSSLSPDICSAKVIALLDQPEVITFCKEKACHVNTRRSLGS